MAQVFKFRRRSTDTNLLDTAGWHLGPNWIPKIADVEEGQLPPPVEEVFTIHSNYTSHDNLAAALISLNQLRMDVRRYMKDRTTGWGSSNEVWLHNTLTNESYNRRALVRKISIEALAEQHGPGGEGSMIDARPAYRLGVEREALWEATGSESMNEVSPSAAASIVYDPTSGTRPDVVGDYPARVSDFRVRNTSGTGVTLDRLWMGMRSENKHGTLSSFANIWECEDADATLGTDAARATDSTASPGGSGNTKVTVTPGTATWAKRLTIRLRDVTTSYSYNLGHFLALLRTKVSAGTWEIHLRFGYENMDDAEFRCGPTKEISGTSWDYIAQGEYVIPLTDLQALAFGTGSIGDHAVQVWARRTSGSGTLDLDCICPVPLDEGYFFASNLALPGTTGTPGSFDMGQSPAGRYGASARTSGSGVHATPVFEAHNFRLPVGDVRVIIVYARELSSVLTDTIQVNPGAGHYYPCWAVLRGSEFTSGAEN
jgi:hypothetical protein